MSEEKKEALKKEEQHKKEAPKKKPAPKKGERWGLLSFPGW